MDSSEDRTGSWEASGEFYFLLRAITFSWAQLLSTTYSIDNYAMRIFKKINMNNFIISDHIEKSLV